MIIINCYLIIYVKQSSNCGKLDKNVEKFRFADLRKIQKQKDVQNQWG
jgi:hypothetical protein